MTDQRDTNGPLWISENDVARLLTLEDAIDVLAKAYPEMAAEEGLHLRRTHARRGAAILHAVGGILPAGGLCGTKTWLYSPAGARPLLILFRLGDGGIAAVIEAFGLGQQRTAATSALGTRLLAREDSEILGLLGTGRQALAQARAITAVRPLGRVQVFGRNVERREEFCGRVQAELGIAAEGFADVSSAVRGADVVTTITRATEPIVSDEMLEPGMHINAVGAIVPGRSELHATAVGRCDVVIADSPAQAREDSAELNAAAAAGLLRLEEVVGLGELAADPGRGRSRPEQITLLKPLGVGLSDVAIGAEVLARASRRGEGSPLAGARTHSAETEQPNARSHAYVPPGQTVRIP